jgi:hypothetical protein
MSLTKTGFTVTTHWAETPLEAVQVIVVVPTPIVVRFPLELIVATYVLLLVQVKVVVAPSSEMIGVKE